MLSVVSEKKTVLSEFSSEYGFACIPQRLQPSTPISVRTRQCHCSVSTSLYAQVTEY
ncbi:hypothetical protein HMPREF3226_00354 [Prevotella corporis]|uniref:Uncharacterized protein n=1 Tax=Prevotella corporis TaxID=28128 RepID=A0A133QLK6_9BACT|nr:hypothetical protein HMPREF3226_00354 [Prevotella corporis]